LRVLSTKRERQQACFCEKGFLWSSTKVMRDVGPGGKQVKEREIGEETSPYCQRGMPLVAREFMERSWLEEKVDSMAKEKAAMGGTSLRLDAFLKSEKKRDASANGREPRS